MLQLHPTRAQTARLHECVRDTSTDASPEYLQVHELRLLLRVGMRFLVLVFLQSRNIKILKQHHFWTELSLTSDPQWPLTFSDLCPPVAGLCVLLLSAPTVSAGVSLYLWFQETVCSHSQYSDLCDRTEFHINWTNTKCLSNSSNPTLLENTVTCFQHYLFLRSYSFFWKCSKILVLHISYKSF